MGTWNSVGGDAKMDIVSLRKNPERQAVPRLVQALQDPDFGVRWAASEALGQLGAVALEEVLRVLADPDRVGDPRLRESAYHMLHVGRSWPVQVKALMASLKGPAPDLASLEEAAHLLHILPGQNS